MSVEGELVAIDVRLQDCQEIFERLLEEAVERLETDDEDIIVMLKHLHQAARRYFATAEISARAYERVWESTNPGWASLQADDLPEVMEQLLGYYSFLSTLRSLGVGCDDFWPTDNAYAALQRAVSRTANADEALAISERLHSLGLPTGGMSVRKSTVASPSATTSNPSVALVMKGGGAKGLALAGAISELSRRVDNQIDAYGGTSVGAITAAVFSLGYGAEEVEALLRVTNFGQLARGYFRTPSRSPSRFVAEGQHTRHQRWRWLGTVLKVAFSPAYVVWRMSLLAKGCWAFLRGGLYSSEAIGRWLRWLHAWSPPEPGGAEKTVPRVRRGFSFQDVPHDLLVVAAMDGSGPNLQVYSSATTPHQNVELAVRRSMSIPGIFRTAPGEGTGIDGGSLANFPSTQMIETYGQGRALVGLYLHNARGELEARDPKTSSIIGRIKSFFNAILDQDERAKLDSFPGPLAYIDVDPIGTLDFNLSDREKELLLLAGQAAVVDMLCSDTSLVVRGGEDNRPKPEESAELQERLADLREEVRTHRSSWLRRLRGPAWYMVLLATCGLWWLLYFATFGTV